MLEVVLDRIIGKLPATIHQLKQMWRYIRETRGYSAVDKGEHVDKRDISIDISMSDKNG